MNRRELHAHMQALFKDNQNFAKNFDINYLDEPIKAYV
jgi:hypothetical protein